MIIKGKRFQWSIKIGVEIHAQLKVASKLFSDSPTTSKYPNASVSFYDAAYPGHLPILNKDFVNKAVLTASAFKCKFNMISRFERKHYFYLDLPLGYQITQQSLPLAHSGILNFNYTPEDSKVLQRGNVRIDRIQIEQDSGKSVHDQHPSFSLIDLNRAGTGLVEIVFSPDLKSPVEAAAVLKTTQEILRFIGVCDGNLETGSMRCDVNVSVSRATTPNELGSSSILSSSRKVEIKNLNSFQRVRDAAEFEANRQVTSLEDGIPILQETRGYDPDKKVTFKIRDKEGYADYRFLPEPDLRDLILTHEDIASIQATLPELPHEAVSRLMSTFGLSEPQCDMLVTKQAVAYFEAVVTALTMTPFKAFPLTELASMSFNWMTHELQGYLNLKAQSFQESVVTSGHLASLLAMIMGKTLSPLQAKQVLSAMARQDHDALVIGPEEMARKLGIELVKDDLAVEVWCRASLTDQANEVQLQKWRGGNVRMVSYFMGDVMKRSKGKADPKIVSAVLQQIFSEL